MEPDGRPRAHKYVLIDLRELIYDHEDEYPEGSIVALDHVIAQLEAEDGP